MNRRRRPARPQRQVRLSTYVTEEEAALIEAAVASVDRPVAWLLRRALQPHIDKFRADAEAEAKAEEAARVRADAEEAAQDPRREARKRLAEEAKLQADQAKAHAEALRRAADHREPVVEYGRGR